VEPSKLVSRVVLLQNPDDTGAGGEQLCVPLHSKRDNALAAHLLRARLARHGLHTDHRCETPPNCYIHSTARACELLFLGSFVCMMYGKRLRVFVLTNMVVMGWDTAAAHPS
jgi:hypothetical protein